MLEEHGELKEYSAGENIFIEGDEGKQMFVVQHGAIEIYRERDGQHGTLATLKPHEFFGEMAFFGDSTRSASARATEDSEILVIDQATFESFINEPVVWQVLEKMSQRIREVDDKLSNYWSKK